MSRWVQAQWVGPTPNRNPGGMVESRGLVLHIMAGSYVGSVAWAKNPASEVSFHFATRKDGHLGQLVDTDDTAWTQSAGNGHWVSVENEGYGGDALTAAQLETVAQLYAWGVATFGWPYQLADTPAGAGLGWHGMGGAAWGGHTSCPGAPIVAQRREILDRARAINAGPALRKDDDMFMLRDANGSVAMVDGIDPGTRRARAFWIGNAEFEEYKADGIELRERATVDWARFTLNPPAAAGGGGQVDLAAVAKAVNDDAAARLAH